MFTVLGPTVRIQNELGKSSRSHLEYLKYSKTIKRPGVCPGSHWGSLQRSTDPLAGVVLHYIDNLLNFGYSFIIVVGSLTYCYVVCCKVSLNPVQVMSSGAEEEKAETARLVCDCSWHCSLIFQLMSILAKSV